MGRGHRLSPRVRSTGPHLEGIVGRRLGSRIRKAREQGSRLEKHCRKKSRAEEWQGQELLGRVQESG